MFEQSLLDVAGDKKKPWPMAVSFLFQCALVGILILVPLVYIEALPGHRLLARLFGPPEPPAGTSAPENRSRHVARTQPGEMNDGRLVAPRQVPDTISLLQDEPDSTISGSGVGVVGIPEGLQGGSGNVISRLLGSPPSVVPPASPPAPKRETPARIRVGHLQQARLIHQVKPVYPPLARQARIQGTVRLEAIISKTGTIESLRYLYGPAMLVEAAMSAVRQWRYQPTILNGEPVEVVTTIDVRFELSH